uniref:DUF559 domain-containing protein n=1 Tax=viral metagenome TaxID=1070528 RepID=A0A6H2A5E6_9ZZZZ
MNILMATVPEMAIYRALTKLEVEFTFQAQMLGANREKGSTIADFQIPSLSLIIRCVGEYWHSDAETKVRDMLQKEALESQGWRVVDIMAEDALANAEYYVREALKGITFAHAL